MEKTNSSIRWSHLGYWYGRTSHSGYKKTVSNGKRSFKETRRRPSENYEKGIENIRLIPNKTTKLTPFEARFGRKPNTEISSIVTNQSTANITYKKKHFFGFGSSDTQACSNHVKKLWDFDKNSEPDLDIQNHDDTGTNPRSPGMPTDN